MRKRTRLIVCWGLLMLSLGGFEQAQGGTLVLRYAHMNPPSSIAGLQADMLARIVAQKTHGALKIQVYPASQLGSITEQAEAVSNGTIAIHHNTMAGIGTLYDEFSALDTPYLYRDVRHLMRVTAPESALMKRLSDGLIKSRHVRVFYTFFFGTRQLSCDRAIYNPGDLARLKIRAIPFPIYIATVAAMGAQAIPMDFAEVPTALATGTVNGQENPVDTIYAAKLYETQGYLMLTNHILGAECVVFNEKIWDSLSPAFQKVLTAAAREVSQKATALALERESALLKTLQAKGMRLIGPREGLNREAFKTRVTTEIARRFQRRYGQLYREIQAIK